MRIDIICNDGSPIGVTEASIHGEDGRLGVGGAELALLTLCRGWHNAGHTVTLFNDGASDKSVFAHRRMDEFHSHAPRDVLIVFRSPTTRIRDGATGLKIWWSCDQRTIGKFEKFAEQVDKIVTISPYHSEYFSNVYSIHDTITIDLPVRLWEYDLTIEKIPYKCIWNSIPDRGVKFLAPIWRRVVKEIPEATLVITSDWRLWDKTAPKDLLIPYRTEFANLDNVTYLGAISRNELIMHELQSQMNLATNTYEELFCIAIAECQVAGAYPVSSNSGAIRTTNMGKIFEGSPTSVEWQKQYTDYVIEALKDQDRLKEKISSLRKMAIQRFSLETILKAWDDKVFANG